MFELQCNCCGDVVTYKSKEIYEKYLESNNARCASCRSKQSLDAGLPAVFERTCPLCDTLVKHKSIKHGSIAKAENRPCRSCAVTLSHQNDKGRLRGENNPMFGKGYTKVWKETLSKKEFDDRLSKHKKSLSDKLSGVGNPMYGKPSPKGSGLGYSGRWKGVYFRSFLELAFLESYFERHNNLPKSAETSRYKILLSSGSNYFPDFEGSDGSIYEIKPSKLLEQNKEKLDAGRARFGSSYIVITENDLNNYKTIHLRINEFDDLILDKKGKFK
jgi:hypothetical protein